MFLRTFDGLVKCAKHILNNHSRQLLDKSKLRIIVDGNQKFSDSCRKAAIEYGLIDSDSKSLPEDEQMTVYESNLQIDSELDAKTGATVYFCIKHLNKGKLDSHWWFFQKFTESLNPSICVQIDAGTIPSEDSLLNMWNIIQNQPTVGGIATRLEIQDDKSQDNLLYAYQHGDFILHTSFIKLAEYYCGCIMLIPGQLGALNWKALKSSSNGDSALDRYLDGLKSVTPFKTTMFLAEDRLIGFELMTYKGSDYHNYYCRKTLATTDECSTL